MNLQEIEKLQKEIYIWSTASGYHADGKTSKVRAERMMFIIGKLGHCLIAYKAKKLLGYNYEGSTGSVYNAIDKSPMSLHWLENFDRYLKGTVGDILADTYIYFLDWCYCFEEVLYTREYQKESSGNFGNDLLKLTHYCMQIFHRVSGYDAGFFLAAISNFSLNWWQIDLDWYIKIRMRYNQNHLLHKKP